jgi:hypothetical protein
MCVCVCVCARARAHILALLICHGNSVSSAPSYIVISDMFGVFDHIFPRYLIKNTILGKKVSEHKICFDFLCNFIRNVSQCKKNFAKYYYKLALACI